MSENITSIEDPTVSVTATPALLEYISNKKGPKIVNMTLADNSKLKSSDLSELVKSLHGEKTGVELRGQELDSALENMFSNGETFGVIQGPYLHELLQGSTVQLPPNPVVQRNPVLAARVKRLLQQQNEQAYQAMTKNISAGKFVKEDTLAYQIDVMNRQLIAVGQVILSVGAGFAFGFLGIPLLVGGMEFGVRILLGLLAAIIIAIAELYFLAKYMNAEDVTQDKEPATVSSAHPHQD